MAEKETKLTENLNSEKRSASVGSSNTSMSSERKLRDRKTLKRKIVMDNSQDNESDQVLKEDKEDDEYHESQDHLAAKKHQKQRKQVFRTKTPDSKNVVTTPKKNKQWVEDPVDNLSQEETSQN